MRIFADSFIEKYIYPTDERITGAAVEFIYKNLFPFLFTLPLVIGLVTWVLWDQVNQPMLIAWTVLSCILVVVRIAQTVSYRRAKPKNHEAYKWGYYFAITAFISGVLWGLAGLLFLVPGATTHQVFIITVIMGLAAGAAMTTCYWLLCFYAFAIPCLGILILAMFLRGSPEWTVLGFLSCSYFILLMRLVIVSYQSFVYSNLLRFENLELIAQLREQKTKAEQANQAKTQFLASASHDLRQPVHALALFADALRGEIETEKGKSIMMSLTKSIESIDELLASLLDISKLDAGVVKVNAMDIQLKPILNKIQNEFYNEAGANLKFRVRSTDLAVHSDPVLLTNIIRNFVSNAFRYTKKGGILVACRRVDDNVSIEVWDTGQGIPQSEQEKIFNEFYQLSNPERDRSKGLGLGLAICHRLCKLLGHELQLASKVDKGSVFKISVPMVRLNFVDTTIKIMPKPLTVKNRVVLVVDDEKDILNAMSTVLESWHYKVIAVSSGAEAIERLSSSKNIKPDLMICDYRLRNQETGLQVIGQVQLEINERIPAIIMTGDTAPERIREAEAGGYPLIHKPVKPAYLFTTLQNLLSDKL